MVGVISKQNLVLLFAVVIIVGAILYLEAGKPKRDSAQSAPAPQMEDSAFSIYPKAPELAGISGYINAPSNLTIASLRGKVVLIDFWTYTCINCIRTLPYVESWHEKYAEDGLVIIGVHTPEFDFEKKRENVQAAVEKYGIKYAVAQDNDYETWRAYQNSYWPRKYLIDANGRIRYDRIGEGGYGETEAKIVELLSEAKNGKVELNGSKPNAVTVNPYGVGTPEIYFGQNFRRAPLGNAQPLFLGQKINATLPAQDLIPNLAYLEGEWENGADGMKLASKNGAVELVFTAKNVNIVAGSMNGTKLRMHIDGKKVERQDYCPDAPYGTCTVGEQRLYSIIVLPDYGTHRLRIEAEGEGFEIFTFTFG